MFATNANAGASDQIVGFTEPGKTIELAASETGALAELTVKRGDRVTAKQVVGSLDTDVLRASRDVAQTRLESHAKIKAAQIRIERAKQDYEKLKQLRDEGHGSAREMELAESDYELARTELESVTDEIRIGTLDVKRINAEIRRRQIISPIDGVVSQLHREVGEFVSPTDPNVLTIVDLRELKVRFYPMTNLVESMEVGDQVSVRLVHSGQAINATIDFIAPVIDADSNTIQVDVLLENKGCLLRSGRRCELVIGSHTSPQLTSLRGQFYSEGGQR